MLLKSKSQSRCASAESWLRVTFEESSSFDMVRGMTLAESRWLTRWSPLNFAFLWLLAVSRFADSKTTVVSSSRAEREMESHCTCASCNQKSSSFCFRNKHWRGGVGRLWLIVVECSGKKWMFPSTSVVFGASTKGTKYAITSLAQPMLKRGRMLTCLHRDSSLLSRLRIWFL